MITYQTNGHLTDSIPEEWIGQAQEYLTSDSMQQYLDPPFDELVETINWQLDDDGYNYRVIVTATRELDETERKELSSWISGQNSDGLGEGFEQQDWAWIIEDCDDCYACGAGWDCEAGQGHMCSFDWETNDSTLVRV